jgi:aspartyl-tRNA(Asn)/glutamyl-tRNA(Gln) amidotransferase subunit A
VRKTAGRVADLIDLGVVDGAAALSRREFSATEWTQACLARISATDGTHSFDGDPESINAWVRVYDDDALRAADEADGRLARGGDDLPPLLGVPIGLKDLYEVAGKPITASSRVLHEVPIDDCDVWRRLKAAGMILLGHLHTHEFAAGGTTDQVGNPHDLTRSAGGSSGGSAAAIAARMVPAATGTDTAGSLRIPSACCGTSTIKPTRNLISTRGIVPLSWSLDHAGPMARSLHDCRALLAAMLGRDHPTLGAGDLSLSGARIAVSPRAASVDLDADVAAGFEDAIHACRSVGATIVEPPPPAIGSDIADDFLDVMTTDLAAYHRRFHDRRDRYRPSLRGWIEMGEARAVSGEQYAAAQARRQETTWAWADWFDEHAITAVIEPTIPVVAPMRGTGYEHAGSDYALIALTSFWDWTGFPVVAFPAGTGDATGLPVSVSLAAPAWDDFALLGLGIELQASTSA